MMASDDKNVKTGAAPKDKAAADSKTTSSAEPPKAEAGETASAAPAGYSRGEGQKPVSKAYKENWNLIYGKKNKKKR